MAADRSAVARSAQSYASRGQFEAAIAEWKKLLDEGPPDGTIHNSIGDLHLKRNAPKEAIAAYLLAGAAFHKGGESLKAIATYKKILKIDPNRAEVYLHLGELNEERGLVSSAIADYTILAKLAMKAGKPKDALFAFRRILKLDSSNANIRKHFQELCSQQKIDPEEYLRAEEPAASVEPPTDGAASAKEESGPAPSKDQELEDPLAEAKQCIDTRNFDKADSLLTDLLNRHPGNPEVCQLLARLHLRRGEFSVAMNEYEFLAGAAMRADDFDLAETLIMEYLEVKRSASLLERLGALYEKKGDLETAASQYKEAIETLLETPDPDLPTLPTELYEKIKELVPSSPLVSEVAALLESGGAPQEAPLAAQVSTESQINREPLDLVEETATAPETIEETDAPLPPSVSHSIPSDTADFEPEAEPYFVAIKGDEDQLEVHYHLGLAYKDMGLLNEAIDELRLSIASQTLFLDSCLEIAGCLRARGMARRGIACLEHALSDPRCQGERSTAVRYELGLLLEGEGLFDRAVRMFETIPTFKDVTKRLEWIKGGGPRETMPSTTIASAIVAGKIAPDVTGQDRKKRRISYL